MGDGWGREQGEAYLKLVQLGRVEQPVFVAVTQLEDALQRVEEESVQAEVQAKLVVDHVSEERLDLFGGGP